MTPVSSSVRDHCPEEGVFGDCHSACLASLLDLPLSEVPLFYDGRPAADCHEDVRLWLLDRGLLEVDVLYPGECSLDSVLHTQGVQNPDVYYLMTVRCGSVCHSVVCCGDEVVHDPSYPVDLGEYLPTEAGHWWLTYLVPSSMRRAT